MAADCWDGKVKKFSHWKLTSNYLYMHLWSRLRKSLSRLAHKHESSKVIYELSALTKTRMLKKTGTRNKTKGQLDKFVYSPQPSLVARTIDLFSVVVNRTADRQTKLPMLLIAQTGAFSPEPGRLSGGSQVYQHLASRRCNEISFLGHAYANC